jgi:hypothetical protein
MTKAETSASSVSSPSLPKPEEKRVCLPTSRSAGDKRLNLPDFHG